MTTMIIKHNISTNITYQEATYSVTAIAKAIDNTPNEIILEKMAYIANKIFEPVRQFLGKKINVNSFFRSPLLNKRVKGAFNSQHITGEAMDISCKGDNKLIFYYILEHLDFDQLIWEFGDNKEPAWVHVSCKKIGNRKQVFRSVKVEGITKYLPYLNSK